MEIQKIWCSKPKILLFYFFYSQKDVYNSLLDKGAYAGIIVKIEIYLNSGLLEFLSNRVKCSRISFDKMLDNEIVPETV